jgi:hypothetical protein
MIVVIVAMAIVIAIGGVIIMAIAIVVIMTIVIFLVLVAVVAVFLDLLSVLLPVTRLHNFFFFFLPSSPSASHTPTCFARRKIGRSPLPL